MEHLLSPRLVVISGIPAGGKSALAEALARKIPNAVQLSRDHIAYGGLLYVNQAAKAPSLPPFEEYVARDTVFPNDAERIETPFGPMTLIHDSARSDFYKRHAREQSYLIMGRLAEANIRAGKVAVIEGFLTRLIQSGALKKFMEAPGFQNVPRYLIHVVASPEVCLARQKARAAKDREAAIRAKTGYLTDAAFYEIMEKEHPRSLEALQKLPHLLLDTSSMTIEDAADRSMQYISS